MGGERSNRGVKIKAKIVPLPLLLDKGVGRVEWPCPDSLRPFERRRAVRNQGRKRKAACLMNSMNFRVTKLFPQCPLKQIPKSHTILEDQGNKNLIKREQASEGNPGPSKSLLSEKQTPHCQPLHSCLPQARVQTQSLALYTEVFPQELPALGKLEPCNALNNCACSI